MVNIDEVREVGCNSFDIEMGNVKLGGRRVG